MFRLELDRETLEGSLESVIARLQELSNRYGKDKKIDLEMEEEYTTFDHYSNIVVWLEGD